MPSINIGIKVDLHALLLRRMMLQASSGGGKSCMLRVITEQLLGNFNNLLGQLRTLGLIPKRGPIKATDYLFPEGL